MQNCRQLQSQFSERKVRLLNCATCRQALPVLAPELLSFIEAAEELADGRATAADYDAISAQCRLTTRLHEIDTPERELEEIVYRLTSMFDTTATGNLVTVVYGYLELIAEDRPFPTPIPWLVLHGDLEPRSVAFDKLWLTDTVVAISLQMYKSRDFSAMPILADALQDAGCAEEAILTHCRGPGPHVRGCWCVDAILGKS